VVVVVVVVRVRRGDRGESDSSAKRAANVAVHHEGRRSSLCQSESRGEIFRTTRLISLASL
jgi:hypothetical protein